MEKIKNVLSPGHSEVDNMLYDTGKISKKHEPTKTNHQPRTDSGSGIGSTTTHPEIGNPQNTIPERMSSGDHTGKDAAIGVGASQAAVIDHAHPGQHGQPVTSQEQSGQYGQLDVGDEHESFATENQNSLPHDSETAKPTRTHRSSLLNKLDPRVKSNVQNTMEESQSEPNAVQEHTPIAAAAGVATSEHHPDHNTAGMDHGSPATKTTESHKKDIFSKLDPRHKSDHQKPAAADDQNKTNDHASAAPIGVGVAGAAVHEHHKHGQHQTDEREESAASKTTEPRKSSFLNRLDPRIKSDHKTKESDDHTSSKDNAPLAAMAAGAGATGVAAHEHQNQKEQPEAFYEPYENRSSLHGHGKHHENTSSGHTHRKLHKEPPHDDLRASSIAQENAAVGANAGVTTHDHHDNHQSTATGAQQPDSAHQYAPQVAAGAGLAGVSYAAHENNQPGRFSPINAQGDNISATVVKSRLAGNTDAASYNSSAPSYASNASIKSGVQGRAPIAMGAMLLPGQGTTNASSAAATHENLPKLQATDGKFMNEDVAKEAGYPHDQRGSTSYGPAALTGAGAASAAYALHRNHKDGESHDAQANMAHVENNTSGSEALTSGGAASAAYALHRNHKDGEAHDSQATMVPTENSASRSTALTSGGAASAAYALHRNHKDGEAHDSQAAMLHDDSNVSGPASKTIGPHKSNLANVIDPRVKPIPELMRGSKDTTVTESDSSGPASKTIGPHESNAANIVDPRVKPDLELMKGHHDTTTSGNGVEAGTRQPYESNTAIKRDESNTSKTAEPQKTSMLGKLVSKVKSNPDNAKGTKHTPESDPTPYTDTNSQGAGHQPVLGEGGRRDMQEQSNAPNEQDGTTDSPSSPSSPKDPVLHKSKILNFLDPRVKSDKSKTTPETDFAHNQSTTEAMGVSQPHGTLEHTPPTSNDTGIGNVSTATTAAKGVENVSTSKAVDSSSVLKDTTSGLADRQKVPPHTDANNAADGKGGVHTGEKAKHGDPSNPYSAEPLDPRVDMPGKYPESSTDLSK